MIQRNLSLLLQSDVNSPVGSSDEEESYPIEINDGFYRNYEEMKVLESQAADDEISAEAQLQMAKQASVLTSFSQLSEDDECNSQCEDPCKNERHQDLNFLKEIVTSALEDNSDGPQTDQEFFKSLFNPEKNIKQSQIGLFIKQKKDKRLQLMKQNPNVQ